MRVIIGFESSGVIRRAFRAAGIDAYSCDLLPADDGETAYHIQDDIFKHLDGWDLGIFHPVCTYLTIAAEWAYADQPTINGKPRRLKPGTLTGEARRAAREKALQDVEKLMSLPYPYAIENPIGVISTRIRKPDQVIQPWMFGEDASKATCLWLNRLPLLEPTKIIEPRWVCCGKTLPEGVGKYGCPNCNGDNTPLPRWGNQTNSGQNKLSPSADRWKLRSQTYPGIAQAMVEKWSHL